MTDARLEQLNDQMTIMAEALVIWLEKQYGYDAFSIFFLCGVVKALLDGGWPAGIERPKVYSDLAEAIDRMGAEVGPMIAETELVRPVRHSSAKQKKHTVN